MQKTVIQTLPNDAHLHSCSLRVIYSEAFYIHTLANQLNCNNSVMIVVL